MKNEEIIKMRKANRYTQRELSQILGVSYSLYQKIEYGLRKPNDEFTARFKKFFKIKK